MKERLKQLIRGYLPIAVLLLAYIVFFTLFGRGIPCVIRTVTGLKCPGCGMSRALSAMLTGHFKTAAEYNILSVTLLPLLGVFFMIKAVRFVITGSKELSVPDVIFLGLCFIGCILFFLYRNDFL